ncbi:MAG: HutD family protein [Burkholderiales bacterium]|nr:HutD family protein [Burkholderiales bacterium]
MSLPYVLAPADYRRMPWKNGGGHTWQIAAEPPGADLASFAWRVSIAAVERDGPFSAFPGVERTLVLLAGRGMRLSGAGAPVELRAPFEPVTFAGDAAIDCALVDGPTRDFNLMVRRSRSSAQVIVVRDRGEPMPPASTYICYAASGACECVLAGFPPFELAPEHTLVVHTASAPGVMRVNPLSGGSIALVAAIEGNVA